jgi:hypothetical protein
VPRNLLAQILGGNRSITKPNSKAAGESPATT